MTRSELLAAFKPAVTPVEVGGRTVHVRPLVVGDMLAVNEYVKTHPSTGPMIFVRAVCDPNGHRLFSDADAGVVESDVVGGLVDAVVSKALEISHIGGDPAGKAPSGPSSTSPAGSPAT